MTASQIFR